MESSPIANVLIVESGPTVRDQIVSLLTKASYHCFASESQAHALELLESQTVDLMLTEVPRLNPAITNESSGEWYRSDAVTLSRWMEALHKRAPHVPMVLLTRPGAERVACEALLKGAASYVPESMVESCLVRTVGQVIEVARGSVNGTELEHFISRTKLEMVLPSQESLVPSVIAKLEQAVTQLDLFDEMVWSQVAMALDEAILNAMIHGNLEVDSSLREVDDGKAYRDLIQTRRDEASYGNRRTHLALTATRNQAVFVIRDEGPGFDLAKIPDPDDPANLESIGGRGLLLIGAFMDETHHNKLGNELTMIKRKASGPSDSD